MRNTYKMKKHLNIFFITLFFIEGCGNHLPTYELQENYNSIVIDGNEYALHKLIINDNTYISEPEQFIQPAYYDTFKIGILIGKTDDGMQIYQVENDKERVVLKGFMYPADFFKLDSSY
ncbi:hypothetical protein [Metabacillus halosaccharovorans]|uniref:hypothetical protein n=1 Tax=Metabacillus halosaccharovorans TaxID=930124 RepID=UPI00203DB565|nr:hypothetical protein [Metabacillus halosaccharovorans]MCM3439627.1 hypothetical protein [Metabacillus halosaccharovorans]